MTWPVKQLTLLDSSRAPGMQAFFLSAREENNVNSQCKSMQANTVESTLEEQHYQCIQSLIKNLTKQMKDLANNCRSIRKLSPVFVSQKLTPKSQKLAIGTIESFNPYYEAFSATDNPFPAAFLPSNLSRGDPSSYFLPPSCPTSPQWALFPTSLIPQGFSSISPTV
ncbi:hypothetical protein [Alkalinema sp. FACHB-956]|uniref:hypothetical protein n=1 Tax=Alkalinema sp. FACHB-956 TaxID=2692768 RepID=UPI0016843751|nr:hypothetical protein [Alkalinema sp. FACHB-956]MBD2330169.1 hypothetical protein [Alkalinema sp. FACHB-956]